MKYHMSLTTVLLANALIMSSLNVASNVNAAESRSRWDKQTDVAWQSYCKGDYAKSLDASKKAFSRTQKPNQKAISLCNLASIELQNGRIAQAELLYLKAQNLFDQVMEQDHPYYHVLLNDLAVLYFNKADYERAQFYFDQIIEADATQTEENQNPQTATILNNLGSLNFKQGNFDKAQAYYEKGLSMLKSKSNKNLLVARLLNNLGVVHAHKNNLDLAENCYKEALEIRQAKLGPQSNHPDLASSLHNMARLYTWQNKLKESEEYFTKAIEKRTNTFGAEHPELAASYCGLGELHLAKLNHKMALHFYNKALAMRIKTLGANHPDTAASYCGLAQALEADNQITEARLAYLKAIEIQEKSLGNAHPDLLKSKLALLRLDSLTAYKS